MFQSYGVTPDTSADKMLEGAIGQLVAFIQSPSIKPKIRASILSNEEENGLHQLINNFLPDGCERLEGEELEQKALRDAFNAIARVPENNKLIPLIESIQGNLNSWLSGSVDKMIIETLEQSFSGVKIAYTLEQEHESLAKREKVLKEKILEVSRRLKTLEGDEANLETQWTTLRKQSGKPGELNKLRAENETLSNTLDDLQEKLDELEQLKIQNKALASRNSGLQSANERLTGELEEASAETFRLKGEIEQERTQLQRELTSARSEYDSILGGLEKRLASSEQALQKTRSSEGAVRLKLKNAEGERLELEGINKGLSARILSLESQIEKYKKAIAGQIPGAEMDPHLEAALEQLKEADFSDEDHYQRLLVGIDDTYRHNPEQAELEKFKAKISTLIHHKVSLSAHRRELSALQDKLKEKENELSKAQKRIKELETQVAPLQKENETLREAAANHTDELEALKVEVQSLTAKLSTAEQDNATLRLEIVQVQEASRTTIAASKGEVRRLQEIAGTLSAAQEKAEAELVALRAEHAKFTNLNSSPEELQAIKIRVSEAQESVVALESQIADRNARIAELEAANAKLKTKNDALEKSVKELGKRPTPEEDSALKKRLQSLTESLTQAQAGQTQAEADLKALRGSTGTIISGLRNELEQAQRQRVAFREEIKTLQERVQRREMDNTGLRAQIEALQAAGSSTTERIATLQGQVATLTQENEKLEAHSAAYLEAMRTIQGFHDMPLSDNESVAEYLIRIHAAKEEAASALTAATTQVRTLQAQLNAYGGITADEAKEYKAAVETLNGEAQSLRDENAQLRGQLAASNEERKALTTKVAKLEKTVAAGQTANADLALKLQAAETTASQLRNTSAAQETALASLREQLATARGEVASLKGQLANRSTLSGQDVRALQLELHQAQAALTASQERVGTLEQELGKSQTALSSVTAERDALRAQVGDLERKNKSLTTQLEAAIDDALLLRIEADDLQKRAAAAPAFFKIILKDLETQRAHIKKLRSQANARMAAITTLKRTPSADHEEELDAAYQEYRGLVQRHNAAADTFNMRLKEMLSQKGLSDEERTRLSGFKEFELLPMPDWYFKPAPTPRTNNYDEFAPQPAQDTGYLNLDLPSNPDNDPNAQYLDTSAPARNTSTSTSTDTTPTPPDPSVGGRALTGTPTALEAFLTAALDFSKAVSSHTAESAPSFREYYRPITGPQKQNAAAYEMNPDKHNLLRDELLKLNEGSTPETVKTAFEKPSEIHVEAKGKNSVTTLTAETIRKLTGDFNDGGKLWQAIALSHSATAAAHAKKMGITKPNVFIRVNMIPKDIAPQNFGLAFARLAAGALHSGMQPRFDLSNLKKAFERHQPELEDDNPIDFNTWIKDANLYDAVVTSATDMGLNESDYTDKLARLQSDITKIKILASAKELLGMRPGSVLNDDSPLSQDILKEFSNQLKEDGEVKPLSFTHFQSMPIPEGVDLQKGLKAYVRVMTLAAQQNSEHMPPFQLDTPSLDALFNARSKDFPGIESSEQLIESLQAYQKTLNPKAFIRGHTAASSSAHSTAVPFPGAARPAAAASMTPDEKPANRPHHR